MPPLDAARKVSEQDCTRLIEDDGGNLLCRQLTEAELRARIEEEERQARARREAAERAERERLERERAEQLAREEAARKQKEAEREAERRQVRAATGDDHGIARGHSVPFVDGSSAPLRLFAWRRARATPLKHASTR